MQIFLTKMTTGQIRKFAIIFSDAWIAMLIRSIKPKFRYAIDLHIIDKYCEYQRFESNKDVKNRIISKGIRT